MILLRLPGYQLPHTRADGQPIPGPAEAGIGSLTLIMPAQARVHEHDEDPLAAVAAVPEIIAAADAARQAVDKLLTSRVLRRRSAEISAEAGLRSARASAALAGVSVPLQELRAHGSSDPIVQGALRCSLELGGLRETFGRAPRQALARLHVLAAADLVPVEQLGRPRADVDEATSAVITRRVGALAELLARSTKAPAVVVAAVVHGELLALEPFAEANGLVARAAARLVLVSRGLDPKALTSPDVGHLELQANYKSAARGYAHGERTGLIAWVTHCCAALELGARDSLAICEALARG
jgi:hypothetical protein